MGRLRGALALLSLASFAGGCQAPLPALAPVHAAMKIDAAPAGRVVDALMAKGNSTWQDAALNYPPLVARRKAAYHLAATAMAGAAWTATLPTVSTSAMAYRHLDATMQGPDPAAGESVYAVTEGLAGAPQVFRLAAANGATLNGAGWDALAGLASPGTIQRSAILLSGDNHRLYMLTSGGYFICLNADTGARLFAQKLSNAGFAGTAPFIDYANGGGWPQVGSDELLYLTSQDGSLFRVRVQNGAFTVTAWPAGGGTDAALWAGRPTIPYGRATTINAFPVAWQNRVYVGTTDGRCVRLDVSTDTPKLTTWHPDWLTSAAYRGITAPVALDFDANFAVSHVFVPCGDRLVWIDPAAAIAEEATYASPPLVLTKTAPVQAALSAFPYDKPLVKGPYDCIDFASIAATANPTPTRWGTGSGIDGRLFGADGYTTPTDGDACRGYMQFEVPLGDYLGYVPTTARIDLSAANNPSAAETVKISKASNYKPGTNQYWTGLNFTPDIDWNNRPNLISGMVGGYTGSVSASDATTGLPRYGLKFDDALPVDRDNMLGHAWHAYAMTSVGKQRVGPPAAPDATEAAKWYRAIDGDNKTEPKIYVTLDTAAKTSSTYGIRCQATVDSDTKKVWVVGSNALFELSYTDTATFQAKANVTYSLTAAGRGTGGAPGPIASGSYVMPKGNVLYTGTNLLVADSDPGTNRLFFNNFKAPLAGAADGLGYTYDAGSGSGQIGEQLLYDYAGGSAYMTTGARAVTRIDIP
jgi:hypothetical protein